MNKNFPSSYGTTDVRYRVRKNLPLVTIMSKYSATHGHPPIYLKYILILSGGPGQRSRSSYSLRGGRSGDRIPVGARFSTLVQEGSGTHPDSYEIGTGSFSQG